MIVAEHLPGEPLRRGPEGAGLLRRRSGYLLDRTLAQCGIDEDALKDRLARYIAWCDAG